MDESIRVQYGMDKGMPGTFKEALDCLKMDFAVKTWMAEDLLKWFISVKDKEVEEFRKMTDEQRRFRFLDYF
ncbi:unnamed protein product [Penicillium camemberti]|uniref:Str. FM013 n=1 Tax=Penicillium camemberti (strain FM 013) TaxID=1429867 RepID=A0A0G4NSP0_PENC3|nr:unnamed protein product [Penicillium camemberti]